MQAIGARDYPLVQGCVLAVACTYVLANLLTDLAQAALDPRLRERAMTIADTAAGVAAA